MTHHRWLRALAVFGGMGLRLKSSDTLYSCLPLYHNNALTVAVSSVINSGATLALGTSFSASRFWDEVIATEATAFIYIGDLPLSAQPAGQIDRPGAPGTGDHRQRSAAGDLGRVHRTVRHSARLRVLCGQRGNSAFINIFNVPRSTGVSPLPLAYVEYDPDTGAPCVTTAAGYAGCPR
ncbi:hypothetical protein NIIDMKKI_16530 [Mycobacterium kansasii]|uniref:AMP-binding enzyme family protein n=1 Tax=Mycobacterium kansasii TaxID=1768 RepID=A0A7G1I648_MYCKA|nr:hypothetical protein NIIDMKKI_16530 [Mycobacterium kansasii]